MQVGNTISVAALNVTIIDADGFTRDFYDAKQMSLLPAISIIVPVHPVISTYNYFLCTSFFVLFISLIIMK